MRRTKLIGPEVAKYLHYLPVRRAYKSRRAGRRASWIEAADMLAARSAHG